ncbi:hypothetical protein FA13DRAFT_1725382 [Coprinellus micaceus]|uniref:Uncharacterized protein n=1 Tax=Coprinellus micaceus TaxID=71717 RepID=A0A4Y7TU77_COPMI|nr:hypothetical protein FA13DRAFT_1725382 [Coprinellus micaceus]
MSAQECVPNLFLETVHCPPSLLSRRAHTTEHLSSQAIRVFPVLCLVSSSPGPDRKGSLVTTRWAFSHS